MQECRHKAWLAASHLTQTPHVLLSKGYEEYLAKVDGNVLVKSFFRNVSNEDAMEVSAVFVLGWCTRFATLLSSACESCKRSQFFQVCQGHKDDLTMVLCPRSYQLRQIAICTIPRLVRPSRQASRCAQTILQWLICSSQDKEVLFFCSAGSHP